MKSLFVLVCCCIFSGAASQSFSKYHKGSYYDLEGNKNSGYIFFSVESTSDYIKFRENEGSKILKLNTKKITSFLYKNDSFTVLHNVRMENSVGNLFNKKRIFAQVIESGNVNLFRYYDAPDSNSRYDNTQGYYHNSPVWGQDYMNFLLQKNGEQEIVGVRKRKYSKFKAQMLEFFKDYPEIQNKIQTNTYRWATLPSLVQEVNALE